jgi:putative peptidoglycan lipid II flippase
LWVFLLSPWIVPVVAYWFKVTPGKFEMTTILNRILFVYIALIGISALATAVLQSFNQFAAPALAPVVLNLTIIGFSFLSGFFSSPAIAMAVGVVVGGVLQVAIQLPGVIRNGWRFHWIWDLAHRECAVSPLCSYQGSLPLVLCTSMCLIGIQFAAAMAAGSTASITFADRVMELGAGRICDCALHGHSASSFPPVCGKAD